MQGPRFGARLPARLSLAGGAWLLAGAVLTTPALANQPAATPIQPGAAAGPAVAHPGPSKGQATRVAQAPAQTRPAWSELGAEQRAALQPLAGTWATLSEAQKRKWLALSRNYGRMAPQEQAKLHSRMNEWVALSPQQRAQARLNFGETQGVSADDKKAKWEAYQALSPEEKRRLAARANARTPPTAAAVKPVPAQKLANVPRNERGAKPPSIASGLNGEPQPLTVPATPATAN